MLTGREWDAAQLAEVSAAVGFERAAMAVLNFRARRLRVSVAELMQVQTYLNAWIEVVKRREGEE